MTKQKWNRDASPATASAVAKEVDICKPYLREIMRGDRTATLLLADKIVTSIKKHCPAKSVIDPRTLMSKEDRAIIRKWMVKK